MWVTHCVMVRTFVLTVILASSSNALAASQGDWFASLYTGDGVELRNDERVFTLFAIFNALGFDQGPVTRKEPVAKVVYHPVRQQVRARVLGAEPEVRKAADAFFDAHPASLQKYLTWVVHGDAPPFVSGPKAKELAELKGFEQVMARAWAGWKLDELSAQVQAEYRKTLKSYLPVIDGPLTRARGLLKTSEATDVVLVVNLLDAQGEVRAVVGEGGQIFLIVGPTDKPNLEGLIREFARVTVEPVVAKQAGKWAGGAQVLREAQLAGSPEQSVSDYATSIITGAVALRSLEANDAAYESAAAKGAFGIKDVAKLFDESRPLDALVADALQKVETRRPVKK